MSALFIDAIGAAAVVQMPLVQTSLLQPLAIQQVRPSGAASFSKLMMDGVEQVNQKLLTADATATAFALDDSIPLHQVTFALEEARLSFELMMQVRNRLVEGYQEILRMQI